MTASRPRFWIFTSAISLGFAATLYLSWRFISHTIGRPEPDGLISHLFKAYMPRRMCMYSETPVIWLHFVSDTIIALSYYSIPLALVYFVKRRPDIVFGWVFWLFAIFILGCGTTHIFGVLDLWRPYYRLDGLIKFGTALTSIITAIALWPLLPKAIALPSRALLEKELSDRTASNERANDALREREADLVRALANERTARSQAEAASRLKDEFPSTLSHELRTPLNAILGWGEILRRGDLPATDVTEGLSVIVRNARAQAQLVDDLLDMSRIISGKLRIESQEVNLTKIVSDAVDSVMPAAQAKDIRLQTTLPPNQTLRGDAARLLQVAWNLLSNAVKFTPRGGTVTVELKRLEQHVELSVTDSGPGIPAEFLPYVFDRFRQADAGTTRRHGGLGLGLAIVKNIVELHGGTVRAPSPGPKQGSTFTIDLPLTPSTDAITPPPNSGGDHVTPRKNLPYDANILRGVSVLVVDDEPDTRDLIRRVLEDCKARVHLAGSSRDAFESILQHRPDVIVSDIGMPDEDGYSLIRRIRALPPSDGGQTPAAALTAFARTEDRRRALLAGYQAHIPKPADPDELVTVVASLAGKISNA